MSSVLGRFRGFRRPADQQGKYYPDILQGSTDGRIVEEYSLGEAKITVVDREGRGYYVINEPPMSQEEMDTYSKLMEAIYSTIELEEIDKDLEGAVMRIADAVGMKGAVDPIKKKILYYLKRDIGGYWIQDALVKDEDVEEISFEGFGHSIAIVSRRFTNYAWLTSNILFADENKPRDIVLQLAFKVGKSVTTASPILEGITPEGHRVAATLGTEVSLPGTSWTIRKHLAEPLSMGRLVKTHTMSPLMGAYLWIIGEQKGFIEILGTMGCMDDQTEVLTKRGWLKWSDATVDDETLSMNPDTFELEYVKPDEKIDKAYSGPMVKLSGRKLDFMVTPDHNMYIRSRDSSKFRFAKAVNISESGIWHFKNDGKWIGQRRGEFVLPAVVSHRPGYQYQDASVPMDDWLDFMGWWLAEGSAYRTKGNHYRIIITQKVKTKALERMLAKLPFHYSKVAQSSSKGTFNYTIYSKPLWTYLSKFGKAKEKFVPEFVKALPPEQIKALLRAYLLGDGTVHRKQRIYFTSSRRMANDLQELILKSGEYASISTRIGRERKISTELGSGGQRDHTTKDKSVSYAIATNKPSEPSFNSRFTKPSLVPYNGRVYCYVLPKYHLLYVRRNGKAFWTGNSGKTTLLASLIGVMPPVKVVTAEDSPELKLPQEQWVSLKTRAGYGSEAMKLEITLMDLARLAMRLRPDYLILGESRGEEIAYVFQAAAIGTGAMCLPGDEMLLASINGAIRHATIRDVVAAANSGSTVSVVSYDQERGKVDFFPVTGTVIKGGRGEDFLEIRLKRGRVIRTHVGHPLLVLRNGKLERVLAKEAKIGDILPVASTLPLVEAARRLSVLATLKSWNGYGKIYVHGANDAFALAMGSKLTPEQRGELKRTRRNGKWIGIPIGMLEAAGVEIAAGCRMGIKQARNTIPAFLPLDGNLGFVVGSFIADGNADRATVSFAAGEEFSYASAIKAALDALGIKSAIRSARRRDSRYWETVVESRAFAALMPAIGAGQDTYTKRVPDIAFNAPREFRAGLVKGYWTGDGHIRQHGKKSFAAMSSTVSRELGYGIGALLRTLGIDSSLHMTAARRQRIRGKSYDTKRQYASQILAGRGKKEFRKMFPEIAGLDRQVDRGEGDVTYDRIVAIEPRTIDSALYDVEVKSTGNFVHGTSVVTSNTTFHAESPEAALSRMRSPPLNVQAASLQLIWSFARLGRLIRVDDTTGETARVRRVTDIAELDPTNIDGQPLQIFTWDIKTDKFTPEDAEKVYTRSYRLQNTLFHMTGWDKNKVVNELNERARFLEENSDLKFHDFYKKVVEFYVRKYGAI